MVGMVRYRREKGRGEAETERFWGLTFLTATLYEPEGLRPGPLERRLEKMERAFRKADVSRVILPAGFPYGERLRWVQPVETLTFYRSMADLLVLESLNRRGIEPARGRVALAGPRLCPELRQAAHRLCPAVREIRIDVPGGEGETFARQLQREWGLPVTPRSEPADVTVSFGPGAGEADLCLWGEQPVLDGLHLRAEGLDLPAELEQPVLALIWEQGGLRREAVRVSSKFA